MKDWYQELEEVGARHLLEQQLAPWLEKVKPVLLKLRCHSDPDVKAAAGELQLHIGRLVRGLTSP